MFCRVLLIQAILENCSIGDLLAEFENVVLLAVSFFIQFVQNVVQ